MDKRELRSYYEDKARECFVPEHDIPGLVRYIVDGVPMGSFLTAVMENDLMEAFGRADEENTLSMHKLMGFIYNHAPIGCHGSPEKVTKWINEHLEVAA